MNKLELTGEIQHIGEIEQLSANAEKRIFVIEIEPGKYSQQVAFELFRDKVSLINNFKEGDIVTVEFNVRGREWKGKWYTNLSAWKISASNATNPDLPPNTEVDDKLGF